MLVRRLALVLITLCSVASTSALADERSYTYDMTHVSHEVDTGRFFGVAHWPASAEDKATFLPRLRKYGIRLVRNDLYLADLVPQSACPDLKTYQSRISDPEFVNSWKWSAMDWMADAKREGFRTMAIFCYVPKFLTANGSLPRKGDTAAWEAWGDICARVYQRMGKQIDYLEIFNEAHFFTKADGTGYKRTIDADPDIFHYAESRLRPLTRKPIGGGVTWIDCWAGSAIETLPFDSRSKPDTIDSFNIHIYDTEPGAFFDRVDHAREVLDGTRKNLAAGYTAPWKNKPIWVTEWNQYWKGKRYGMDWYGFVLTEFLKRGVPNVIYDTKEFFDPKKPSQCKPWLLLVNCGLNSRSQIVRIRPEATAQPFTTATNSFVCTLPGGSVVILATNATDSAISASWNLAGLKLSSLRRYRVRKWDAVGEGPDLTTVDEDATNSLTITASGCTIMSDLPPHSMTALRLEHK